MIVSTEDSYWLGSRYPGLVPDGESVTGRIEFAATYNEALNRFLILAEGVVDDIGGIKLSSAYDIRIVKRDSDTYSALPAVYVTGIDLVEDRHFGWDTSACLCSPIEEKEFLRPTFDFRRFLEHLVVPFLYGQSFYSEYHHWPWKEYAHGATGLLESFNDARITEADELGKFLATLAIDKLAWPQIRAVLQKDQVKGHTPCFCPKRDQIRRCHPKALAGVRDLQEQVKQHALSLPPVADTHVPGN